MVASCKCEHDLHPLADETAPALTVMWVSKVFKMCAQALCEATAMILQAWFVAKGCFAELHAQKSISGIRTPSEPGRGTSFGVVVC